MMPVVPQNIAAVLRNTGTTANSSAGSFNLERVTVDTSI